MSPQLQLDDRKPPQVATNKHKRCLSIIAVLRFTLNHQLQQNRNPSLRSPLIAYPNHRKLATHTTRIATGQYNHTTTNLAKTRTMAHRPTRFSGFQDWRASLERPTGGGV